ncbi:MAG: NAD(P)-dependent oxidoreductase [Nitrospira sp.]|nr:NAD(P)-dependent oxidoreductase [Nitrospira sp.]
MSNTHETIGFVGVGRMGANMARRLKDFGFPVSAVYDRQTSAAEALAKELGCQAAADPAAVAQASQTVITVVTDDAAMDQIFAIDHPASLLAHAKGRLFINCATVSPSIHREMEQRVTALGGASLEACMASSITQARQGTLYLMCAGRRMAFERAKPMLHTLGSTVRYVGASGSAAEVKALVNMVMNCNTAALAEGLGLGQALGLDLTMLREVFSQTGANSRVLETDGEDMQQRAHECYFSAAHAAKDSGIAVALGQAAGLTLPVAGATLAQYRRLVERGKGELDKSAIAELTFKDRQG